MVGMATLLKAAKEESNWLRGIKLAKRNPNENRVSIQGLRCICCPDLWDVKF
jgi:hypothetical protein